MNRKLLGGSVLLGAGILALVFGLSSPKAVYARSVPEFLAHPIYDRPVRVTGTLVHGSLLRASASCEYRFSLAGGGSPPSDAGPGSPRAELAVHYPDCIIPDGFRDMPCMDLQVTVEGELCTNCHRFEASQVIVKCPGKYWRPRDGALGSPEWPPCPAK